MTDEWVNRKWFSHVVEYYLTLKRKGMMTMLHGEFFLLTKADISHLSVCRAQEQHMYLNSSWAQKRVKEGREVLMYLPQACDP